MAGHKITYNNMKISTDYHSEIIEKVRVYPVTVMRDEESYVLILCDKDSKFILYKGLGRTIDFVDYPYFREGKTVSCKP